ncbi:MAG: RNA methyltransferase [Bacteroidota bacterium]
MKKFRDEYRQFVAEGDKIVKELLVSDLELKVLVATKRWLESLPAEILDRAGEILDVSEEEMGRISFLKSPGPVLAVAGIPERGMFNPDYANELILMLDRIQDPGNFGTIVRTADWFGVRHIFCSCDSADLYNPKVIQSTMGAFVRVRIQYADLEETLGKIKAEGNVPIYGAYLEGSGIYSQELSRNGLVIIGNESAGISGQLSSLVSYRLFIPGFPPEIKGSESLNAASAAAIICSEFRRRLL